MTPIAQRVAKEMTLPLNRRQFADDAAIGDKILGVHCFECSDVWPLVSDLQRKLYDEPFCVESLCFLPAPLTWIEWIWPTEGRNTRVALLFEEQELDGIEYAKISLVDFTGSNPAAFLPIGQSFRSVMESAWVGYAPDTVAGKFAVLIDENLREDCVVSAQAVADTVRCAVVLLSMINTPKIIGRRQHMPHAGLQRTIARSRGMVGKFPLHGWTEIKLEIMPPVIDEGGPYEARLTGARALHFCRAHLRIKNGKLEHVRAHWRGDPALGIKRSRYTLVPPKSMEAP